MSSTQQMIYILAVQFISISIYLLLPFYLLKYRGKNSIPVFLCSTVLMFLFCMFTKSLMIHMDLLRRLVNFAAFGAIVSLVFRDGWKKKMIVLVTVPLLASGAEFLTGFVLKAAYAIDYSVMAEYNNVTLIGMILLNMISFIFNMYLIILWKRFVEKKRMRGIVLYITVPVYQLVLLLMFLYGADEFDLRAAILGFSLLVMGMVINMVMMYLLQEMEQKLEVEEKLSHLYLQRQYELDYYRIAQQHLDEMQAVRHDFVNQIQTAYMMIQEGNDAEKAESLLAESYQQLIGTRLVNYCENPVVNALISVKAAKAQKKGIIFETECQFKGLDAVEEIDLCSLFGNMLDNAIEACGRIPEGNYRHMILKARVKGDYQVIRTENTYSKKEWGDDFFKTSKADKLNHGYGMKLIERICQKYGGELMTEVTDQQVFVTAILRIHQGEVPKESERP